MVYLIKYNSFIDISSILWGLQGLELTIDSNHFTLADEVDEYVFVTDNDSYHPWGTTPFNSSDFKFDKKILASSKFTGYDTDEFDYMIYSNLVEPLHSIYSNDVLNFLNDGNVILSSTYTKNIFHENLISDYRFNLYYFYHDIGFNFLNYYNLTEKDALFGIYEKESSSRYSTTNNSILYQLIKDKVKDELIDLQYPRYPLKELISYQPRDTTISFGMWKNNHISSYTDMSRCVVFYSRESLVPPEYSYDYITEKTLKSILYSKSNVISIWHGREESFEKLNEYGFWFLNSEFYTNNIVESVNKATDYCLDLKSKLNTNELVFEYLISKYKDKLENNFKLINDMLFDCPIKNEIKTCISKR